MKFLLILIVLAPSCLAKMGEFCDSDLGPESWCMDGTHCIDNKCGCPPETTFFPDHNHCKKKVGDTCEEHDWPGCGGGSKCINGVCGCQAPSTPLSNGGCTSKYHGVCSSSLPCNSGQFLDCIDGRCHCESEISMFEEYNSTSMEYHCRAKANGAICSVDGVSAPTCVENADCINGACQCADGYAPTLDGTCRKTFQEPCLTRSKLDTIRDCNLDQGLVCKNDVCACREVSQKWDSERQMCVIPLGEFCGVPFGLGMCEDPNASCQYNPGNGIRATCRCVQGFNERNGVCEWVDGCSCPQKTTEWWTRPMPAAQPLYLDVLGDEM